MFILVGEHPLCGDTNELWFFLNNQKLKEFNPPFAKPFRRAKGWLLEALIASAEPFRSAFSLHYTIFPSAGAL